MKRENIAVQHGDLADSSRHRLLQVAVIAVFGPDLTSTLMKLDQTIGPHDLERTTLSVS